MLMYDAIIKKRTIVEQMDCVLYTVELRSKTPIAPEVVSVPVLDDTGNPKLDKDGNVKQKLKKPKYKTKTVYFKFPITTLWRDIKIAIKAKVEAVERVETEVIPIGVPIDFSK